MKRTRTVKKLRACTHYPNSKNALRDAFSGYNSVCIEVHSQSQAVKHTSTFYVIHWLGKVTSPPDLRDFANVAHNAYAIHMATASGVAFHPSPDPHKLKSFPLSPANPLSCRALDNGGSPARNSDPTSVTSLRALGCSFILLWNELQSAEPE